MPELKNYRLLISHSWKYNQQYDKIVSWLNSASNFKWYNHSVSADRPFNTKTKKELKNELTEQIRGCNAVVVVSGMYAAYSEWINYEIDEAIRMKKPIIGIEPWGSERTPKKISDNANIVVKWNSSNVIGAIRKYAL